MKHYYHKRARKDKFEIITPPISILAEPPVAVVDKVVDKKEREKWQKDILNICIQKRARNCSENFYRPRNEKVEKYASQFPKVQLFTVDELFGGWKKRRKNILMMAVYSIKFIKIRG